MSDVLKEFIEEARGVSIEAAARALNLKFQKGGTEHPGPCPSCGGTDTFAFNTRKNKWNCRHGGVGGNDGIGMAAHALDLDAKTREGLLEACSAVLGRPIPAEGERESEQDRIAREERIAERQAANAAAAEQRAASQEAFREKERGKARGIYTAARPLLAEALPDGRHYLARRGAGVPEDGWLRVAPSQTYWHGRDALGHERALYGGPALVSPFLDATGGVIGCHITWIDLSAGPKFRPVLVDPDTGETLPTKKMRGSKKGGLIPLAGALEARRWVGGEGIENGLAFARWEGFRGDTFYFAAGDLGNLAGPADEASRFRHPTLTKQDAKGRARPVWVPGPVPKPDQAPDDAMPVPDHVDELVLLGDGDSEPVFTAAAMARARARLARPGRLTLVVWPRAGFDFSGMAVAL